MIKPKRTRKEHLANFAMGAYIGFGVTLMLAAALYTAFSK